MEILRNTSTCNMVPLRAAITRFPATAHRAYIYYRFLSVEQNSDWAKESSSTTVFFEESGALFPRPLAARRFLSVFSLRLLGFTSSLLFSLLLLFSTSLALSLLFFEEFQLLCQVCLVFSFISTRSSETSSYEGA